MGEGVRYGRIYLITKETMQMVSNMAKDNSNGQTEVNTLVILYTIIYEDMVHTHGKMADVLLANTRTIKCMEVGLSLGRMVGNT